MHVHADLLFSSLYSGRKPSTWHGVLDIRRGEGFPQGLNMPGSRYSLWLALWPSTAAGLRHILTC